MIEKKNRKQENDGIEFAVPVQVHEEHGYKAAFTMAMAMATMTLNGSGILIQVTATVRKVSTSSAPATLNRVEGRKCDGCS
jgi:hypothetical protein